MNCYDTPWGGTAKFILHNSKGQTLAETDGRFKRGGPFDMDGQKNATDYPLFEVVTADGITEVMEFKKMEPIFYITDDSAVRAMLMGVQSSE